MLDLNDSPQRQQPRSLAFARGHHRALRRTVWRAHTPRGPHGPRDRLLAGVGALIAFGSSVALWGAFLMLIG